ncbi:NTF2 fold immunity protein [Chryseobacterium balustinum]|uniref:NTF2 fold immunity protein n=1 Tax=Chryseobacterium balustinum TaxID=246 RepID=UPI003CF60167
MKLSIVLIPLSLTAVVLSTSLVSCSDKLTKEYNEANEIEYAKTELKSAIIKNEILPDRVIPDSQTAVNVAENILFKTYGKENIIKQRPYDVNFTDGYYIINGTFPKPTIGGTFLIIINSQDGKVIKLTHGK